MSCGKSRWQAAPTDRLRGEARARTAYAASLDGTQRHATARDGATVPACCPLATSVRLAPATGCCCRALSAALAAVWGSLVAAPLPSPRRCKSAS
eukprot:366245-Chlamydomonas_euryale.AAC.13